MIHTIRVAAKNEKEDLLGVALTTSVKTQDISKVLTVKVYRLEGITKKEAELLAEKLFCESINQKYSVNTPLLNSTKNILEISYKPGVMNPEVASIIKSAKDLGINLLAADSSREYAFYGKVSKEEIAQLVKKLQLFNPTVEHLVEEPPKTLLIEGVVGKTQTITMRNMTDEQLLELSKDKLFLNLEEMQAIQKYFQKIKRDPTDCELETLAQTWSEHSGHKTFKAKIIVDGKEKLPLIKRLKKEALKHKKHIVSAFVDNSGVMDFYNGYAISGKGETHNSPSAIEPYGGAMTGSGGVFRDIVATGQGGKTLISTDVFCFAPWDFPTNKLPQGTLPPKYLLKRVVEGVRDYGNRIGIPTNNGSIHFHEDFRARPTVLVGAYGIMPKKLAKIGKPKKGNVIVVLGGRTGRDGIHGATFSSGEMTERTISVNNSAVQIGNAIEEKRVFDALMVARDLGLIKMMQDVGGGGLSSAIGEVGSDLGVRVDLEKAPLKYSGLTPWEIWISESQERMVVVLDKKSVNKFFTICKKYNVEATVLGHFDGSKKLQVYYGKEKVADLDMEFLHNGLPQRKMTALRPKAQSKLTTKTLRSFKTEKDWTNAIQMVLAHGNVCSKEPIVRMYDHSVQGTNDLQPFSGEKLDGPNDAVVIRPFLNKKYGMIVSHGLNPILNNIDPYKGSIWAAIEALSNYVAVGGNYKEASLINNYVWPFPDEESLWSLDKSVDAVVDIMKTFKTPVISGKDSLSSTYRGKDGAIIKIPPVLCISVFGRIKDASKTISSDFKKTGSTICLIGKLDTTTLGGSIYSQVQNTQGVSVPTIDLKLTTKVFDSIYNAIQKNKLLSVHDISEGGLIGALFEMGVGGDMGCSIVIPNLIRNLDPEYFLFNETAGTFIVEVADKETAEKLFKNVPYTILGETTKEKNIVVKNKKENLFSIDMDILKEAWKNPMKEIFN